jgi:hypothetical protein
MRFADDARKILQNVPMRLPKPVIKLLSSYKRRWKLTAKETTIWLHNVNGDPIVGRSKEEMSAELFQDEFDEDAIDDPTGLEVAAGIGPRDPVEVVIEDPPSLGMRRSYLDGLSDIEISVSSRASRHHLVAIRWEINGTHTGTLLGEPASGRPVTVAGMTVMKFQQTPDSDGKTVFTATEEWTCWDLPSLLEQVRGSR